MGNRWTARDGVLLAGGTFLLLWRAAAFLHPHPGVADTTALRVALACLGAWFAACGIAAFVRSGPAAFPFALSGIAFGLHWGGPLHLGSPRVDVPLLGFYLMASSVAAQALFLHVTLAFPPPLPAARRRGWLVALHAPAALGGLAVAGLALAGPSSTTGEAIVGALPSLLLIGPLYAATALVVWVVRLRRARPGERGPLGWIVSALVVGAIVQVAGLAGALPGSSPGWWSLLYGLTPLALVLGFPPGEDREPDRRDQPRAPVFARISR